MTQKDREAQAVDVRNPKHAWEMLAAANTKIKTSRLHTMCVATQDHCSFTETDCVNITILSISLSEEETAEICCSNQRLPSLPNNVYGCM